MSPLRDLRLGRLRFPVLLEELAEQPGGSVDTVGAAPVLGDPTAEKLDLKLPVRGQVSEGRTVGDRLRRQLRGLLSNPAARAGGLYLAWTADPEHNGWILIGGADLKTGKRGVTFGDYELDTRDSYRVGRPQTHRPARRAQVADTRAGTAPRDYRGQVFTTDFSTSPAIAELALPVGARALRARGRGAITSQPRIARDGLVRLVAGLADGETVTYEQTEPEQHRADTLILDRTGGTTS